MFICKLDDDATPPDQRKIHSFVLARRMPGFEQSKPLRKMGRHSSPTGELFIGDVRVGCHRLVAKPKTCPPAAGCLTPSNTENDDTDCSGTLLRVAKSGRGGIRVLRS